MYILLIYQLIGVIQMSNHPESYYGWSYGGEYYSLISCHDAGDDMMKGSFSGVKTFKCEKK